MYLTHPLLDGPVITTCPLEGVIGNPEYYKNFKQTSKILALTCAKYLEVLSIHECMFGHQDLMALRKS